MDDTIVRVTVSTQVLGTLSCSPSAMYDRKSHVLSWIPCDGQGALTPVGARVLTPNEAAEVEAYLGTIAPLPAAEQVCGGEDGLDYFLETVGAASKIALYSANGINCHGETRVTGLSDTYGLLVKLR